MYRKSLVDIMDSVMYFNILALAVFSLYDFKTDVTKQTAIAYTSTIITFILLVIVIVIHVALLPKKKKPSEAEEVNEYPLAPTLLPVTSEVTYSDVEVPKPQCQPSSTSNETTHDISDRQTLM